jgi:ABC-type transporter Mla subunit MlaD
VSPLRRRRPLGERIIESINHLSRSIMALSDSVQNITTAVNDAVTEIRQLAETIRNTGDVGAAASQLDTLAGNLEQAVSDASAPPTPPPTS